MLWSLVLPFQVAFVLSIGVAVLGFYVARRYRKSRVGSVAAGIVVAGSAFVPLCILVYYATSPFRFGRFQADDTNSVRLAQVRQYLPPNATDIDMITTTHQHHVRFRVSERQLIAWMNKLWNTAGTASPMLRNEAAFGELSKGDDAPELVRLGMNPATDYMYFEGPYQGDWGGPTLWYDPAAETAWQDVGYW
jgi:hypothetical protein